jgi:hypothetical protein
MSGPYCRQSSSSKPLYWLPYPPYCPLYHTYPSHSGSSQISTLRLNRLSRGYSLLPFIPIVACTCTALPLSLHISPPSSSTITRNTYHYHITKTNIHHITHCIPCTHPCTCLTTRPIFINPILANPSLLYFILSGIDFEPFSLSISIIDCYTTLFPVPIMLS